MVKKWYEVDMNNSKCRSIYEKQMLEDLANLFKNGYSPPDDVPDCDVTFCDNFETSWFDTNTYISEYTETFELAWFIDNNFILDYDDGFESTWFIYNNYINQDTEDFEDVDWDE